MINPIKVADGIYRGPSPQTGFDWQALHDLGIKYTLDLQSGAPLMDDGSPLREQLCAQAYGIRTFCHPLGEIFPPNAEELYFAMIVLKSSLPIYVHCKAGVDRTGMIIAYYRIRVQGWSREDAIAEMRKLGMHPWYFYWIWSLK